MWAFPLHLGEIPLALREIPPNRGDFPVYTSNYYTNPRTLGKYPPYTYDLRLLQVNFPAAQGLTD